MNPSVIDTSESAVDRSLGSLRLAQLRRYGLTVLSVGVALRTLLLLQDSHFRVPSALLLLFVVAISSWYGGIGPAVLSVVLSIISFYWYFVEPVRTIYISPSQIPYFIIFVAFALLLMWFSTIRRRDEGTLRERANLLNLTHDTIFVMTMEGVIKYWNRGAEEQYGWIAEQALGTVVYDLLKTVFPAPLEQIKAELVRTGRWEGELVHTKKDGAQVVVASRWSLQRSERGAPVAILETNNDITERKRAEEQRERLRQLEADLAHINRVSMMGELAASISHEVNQPLSGVVSNGSASLRWLAGEVPNLEEVREGLQRIVRDGKRAGEVIARIRALTRRAEMPREQLDLNDTMREVLALVGDEAKGKSVIIRTRFAEDLSPVSGDRVQLQQVVLNLVMNGIEAMSSVGERARELLITTGNVDADQVQVSVEDSGIGIDPQKLDKIFDSFYTTKPSGMGMGLSISRSILQAHGGRLWATAKDGPGTIFHFTLPKYPEGESHAGV